ncbi:Alpha/Beta hydrolase protein [Mycena maculata]|uniref:Carboxylic ester hydrolase n=1 Tax=Mycena maculata TaxID=230809 RepID=A0AAD7NBB0_9AGAR|nr:Alpha/Beta hydrolase protein [Mycena maculata]
MPVQCDTRPVLNHRGLATTFHGIRHAISTPETPIHQYRGIKYAYAPARFRQSRLLTTLALNTDSSHYGPICPQLPKKCVEEELFGLGRDNIPQQVLEQNEFGCLNLNITCPAGLTSEARIPVLLWIHGGGDRGYGSSRIYDGGPIVRKSMVIGKPVILVTFNFRIGLLGFAASLLIQEDNEAAGDIGTGNYGLRDQRTAMEWVHHYIQEFGGDPDNVTLFGESSGAADIVCHLLSNDNADQPLFRRAIIQSALIDHNIPNIGHAGWHLSRVMGRLGVSTVRGLRAVSCEKLIKNSGGWTLRAVDDGHFFLANWRTYLFPQGSPPPSRRHQHTGLKPRHPPASSMSHSRLPKIPPLRHQPLIIGDAGSGSFAWSFPTSLWKAEAVVRRLNAICQSVADASRLLSSYDICLDTSDSEIGDRVLDLISDTRVAWPTECLVARARQRRDGQGVWRYVFDQDAPAGINYKTDLAYVFDNVPHPAAGLPQSGSPASDFSDSFDLDGNDDDENDLEFDSDEEDEWLWPPVDEWTYKRVRDTIQERWIAFANGEEPWNQEKIFVFGPEGEVGERSTCIFEGRRRRAVWKQALEPLGMPLVQKIGMELSRGPPMKSGRSK